jgi:hypothetical protein
MAAFGAGVGLFLAIRALAGLDRLAPLRVDEAISIAWLITQIAAIFVPIRGKGNAPMGQSRPFRGTAFEKLR